MRCLAAIPRLGGTGAAAPDSGRGPRAAPLDGVQQAVHLARGQVLAFILRLSHVRWFGSLRIQGLVTVRPVNIGQKVTFLSCGKGDIFTLERQLFFSEFFNPPCYR